MLNCGKWLYPLKIIVSKIIILEVLKNNKLNPISSKMINLTSSPEQIKLHSFKREFFNQSSKLNIKISIIYNLKP